MSDVEADFKRVLAAMHFLSYGTTGALEGRVTGSKERPLFPAGEATPLFAEFEARWRGARSVAAKRAVYEAAQEALHNYKKQKPGQVIEPQSIAWKREIAAREDVPDKELCRLYSISRVTLWRYRRDYREDAA